MIMMELPFTLDEYQKRFEALRIKLFKENIDTAYLTSPESIYYYTGHHRMTPGGKLPIGVAVNTDHDNFIFFCEKDEEILLKRTSVTKEAVYFGTEWGGGIDPYPIILNTLKDKGWLKGRIGVEKGTYYPSHDSFEELTALFVNNGAHIVDVSKLISGLRVSKSQQELYYIKNAAKIADSAMIAAIKALVPGVTELDIVAEIESTMYKQGGWPAVHVAFVQSGPRSIMQHCVPTQRVINKGDIVQIDFCGSSQRYHADLGRTFCLGIPNKKVAEVMKTAAGSYEYVESKIKPGDTFQKLGKVTQDYYKSHGIKPWYDLGYTLGIGFAPSWMGVFYYEEGYILDPGVVINFDHCFTFEHDNVGTCIIDTLVMTEIGFERLSSIERDLIIL